MHNRVGKWVVAEEARLDQFLAFRLPEMSRTKVAKWIEEGGVLVNGEPAKPSRKLKVSDQVDAPDAPTESIPHDLEPANIPIDIRFEDEDVIVVNKPRGLAAHPASTLHEPSLVNALLAYGSELSTAGGDFRPGIVHRLDKETTGLMVIAKNDAAHAALAQQFEHKTARRTYVGIVAGTPDQPEFVVESKLGRDPRYRQKMAVVERGKHAITECKVIGKHPEGTLMRFRLQTGRTHQIRVHLAAAGHPILGDEIYAPKGLGDGPLQLHAIELRFTHPRTKLEVITFAEPPADFRAEVSAEQLD